MRPCSPSLYVHFPPLSPTSPQGLSNLPIGSTKYIHTHNASKVPPVRPQLTFPLVDSVMDRLVRGEGCGDRFNTHQRLKDTLRFTYVLRPCGGWTRG